MRLPTRVIREWKTVTSSDGEEIVWIAVLDNGEFALCVELPEQRKPMDPEVWEMLQRAANGRQHQDEETVVTDGLGRRIDGYVPPDEFEAFPEVDDLTADEQGRTASERFKQERDQMRGLHERRAQ